MLVQLPRDQSRVFVAARKRKWLQPDMEVLFFGGAFFLSLLLTGHVIYRLFEWPWKLADAGAADFLCHAVVGIALMTAFSASRWSALFLFSFLARRKRLRQPPASMSEWPFVSVLVPCFNEGGTIWPALESLLELDYPAYEVIVVDDGSSDETLARAMSFQGEHGGCSIRVYRKLNGGKWSALNSGFRRAKGELILCVDADSRLEPCSLKLAVLHMADPSVSAVAGQVRVRNRVNPITRLQGLEYLMGNGAVRLSQDLFQTVLVVPGPIGLFRRSVLEQVWFKFGRESSRKPGDVSGPFEGDTFAEDSDLSVAILCLGGRIVYEPEAISHTNAPDTLFTLINQRYRWIRGSLQVLRKLFLRAMADPQILSPRLLGWITLANLADYFSCRWLSCSGRWWFLRFTSVEWTCVQYSAGT